MSVTQTQERLRKEKAEQQADLAKQQAEREAAAAQALASFKLEIEDNDESIRKATEYLVETLRLGTSQRAAAEAVGRSASWINRLTRWAKAGYPACGPFSADGKARRKRDNTKSVLPAKQPKAEVGIGHNNPPPDSAASAERPIEQVRDEFAAPPAPADTEISAEVNAALADETPPPGDPAPQQDSAASPEGKAAAVSARNLREFEVACGIHLPKLNEADLVKAYACFQKWGGGEK